MGIKARLRRQFTKDIILSRHHPPGPSPFVFVLDHMKPTFNVGKIIRTANAFGVREVALIGMPVFNPKPCAGALTHTRTRPFDDFRSCYDVYAPEGYELFALSTKGDVRLGEFPMPPLSAFIVGHEEFGLSFDPAAFPKVREVRIPQFGVVDSLNASVAAAIAGYEYLRQQSFPIPETQGRVESRPWRVQGQLREERPATD